MPKPLSVISGLRDAVNTLSAGFSPGESDWQLGYAFLYHAALGGSNSLSVVYFFKLVIALSVCFFVCH